MEAFNRYLRQFPHYTPNVFEQIKPHLIEKELEVGAYFLEQGRVCRSIAFIENGLLRLHYSTDNKEVTNCFCKENSITCSYSSLITGSESDIGIQAIEPSRLWVIPYISLQKLYEKDLFWQQLGRLAAENEYITKECHHRFLTDLSATERYKEVLKNESDLLQRVPLNYLASYLQVAPETLSRIRKKISVN